MKTKLLFLILILFNVFQTAFADVDISECDAYRQKSDQLNCGEDNYFITFGERYCQIFVAKNDRFTTHGQEVLADMRSCLIQSMQSDETMTCENAKELAEEQHFNCYMQSNYCSLGFYDRLQLGWIVRQQFFDLGFLALSERINSACYW